MSSANRESLLYKEEVTEGTNPAGAATYLNFTGNTLKKTNQVQNSNFVRSDTNVAGTVRVGVNVAGDIGTELQYGEYDPFIEAVLRGTFSTALSIVGDTTVSFTASTQTIAGTGLFTNATVGQWIKVSGSDSGNNDGYLLVTSVPDADSIVVAGFTLTDESAGEAITIRGAVCENSTTGKSYTLERAFNDHSTVTYQLFTGQKVNTLGFTFGTSSISTGTISFLGRDGVTSTSSGFSGSHTAASTTPSMNTVDNIKAIYVNRAVSTLDFLNFDFSFTTNSEALAKIGSLTSITTSQRSIGVTGSFSAYFEDTTLATIKDNFTSVDLAVVAEDDDGNGYVFHFPQCFLADGGNDNTGINTDIQETYSFSAVLDPTLGTSGSVSRFPGS